MHAYHLYFVIVVLSLGLIIMGLVLHRVRSHMSAPKHAVYPDCRTILGSNWEMRQQASRAMIEILCDTAMDLIEKRIRERNDPKDPVEIAITMIDVTIRTGHYDVLDAALTKVDPKWPKEIVAAFWNETAAVQDKLPAREAMWHQFRQQLNR